MIPSIFLLFNSLAFLISFIEETPPEITTGQLDNNKIEGIIVGKAIYDGDIKLEELAKEISA